MIGSNSTWLFLLIIFFCFSSSGWSQENELKNQGIHFETGKFKKIKKKAKREHRPLFIDFTAAWCLPCQMMEEGSFRDYFLGKYFKDNFVCYQADIETNEGKKLKKKMDIGQLPTMVFISTSGRETRLVGAQSAEILLTKGKEIIGK